MFITPAAGAQGVCVFDGRLTQRVGATDLEVEALRDMILGICRSALGAASAR